MELGFLPQTPYESFSEDTLPSRKLQELVDYAPRPYTDLEIEITTRCNLCCPGCPRTVYHRSWIDQDMSLNHFERLMPVFSQFQTLHFRGWGEPLLNPFFPEMVRLAYQSGARLVLSTNGAVPMNKDLLPYFDSITIRLDYGRAATYERRNPCARFNRTLYNISQMLMHRDETDGCKPHVALLFAKNKHSLDEMTTYLETAARVRPDRVVFYRPFFHFRGVDARSQLPANLHPDLIEKAERKLIDRAREEDLDMVNQRWTPGPPKPARCVFDPDKGLFVSWNGRAALCRFCALPVANGTFTRHYPDRAEVHHTTYFGNLIGQRLDEIARTPDWRRRRAACRLKYGRPGGGRPGMKKAREDRAGGNVIHLDEALPKAGLCTPR